MSSPIPPANAAGGNYHLGGTLTASPQPDEPFFPLRRDQFLTFRDGEMSGARSIRDVCVGVFITGLVGLASILAPLDEWKKAPMGWTLLILVLIASSLAVGALEQLRIRQTHAQSAYARLVQVISEYFGIP
jgi:hypothetical protein